MHRLFFLILSIYISSSAFAAEQRPPFTVSPSEECHIADAKPFLDKSKYTGPYEYNLKTITKKPLVLLESVKLEDNSLLKIEQRGCEDIYFKFQYESKNTKSNTDSDKIRIAADVIAHLQVSKDALINDKQTKEISNKVKAQLGKLKNQSEFTVCLMNITSECITDVKVSVNKSGLVEFYYVDRP